MRITKAIQVCKVLASATVSCGAGAALAQNAPAGAMKTIGTLAGVARRSMPRPMRIRTHTHDLLAATTIIRPVTETFRTERVS